MKLNSLPRRIYRKIIPPLFNAFGYDNLTLVKIHARKDLRSFGSKNAHWVIPTDLVNSKSIVYCVGCGEDITFDLELIKRFKCDVFAFDPTPRAVQHVQRVAGSEPKYIFQSIGLWDQEDVLRFYSPANPANVSHSILNLQKTNSYIELKVDRLKNIMQRLGHSRLDLLKIDIEGAEYKVLQTILDDEIDIKVLCVEFDEYFHALDKQYRKRIIAAVEGLLKVGYDLVCADGDGNYTFVKK